MASRIASEEDDPQPSQRGKMSQHTQAPCISWPRPVHPRGKALGERLNVPIPMGES